MNPSLRLVISIDDQTLKVVADGALVGEFPVSTSARGVGFESGSYRTPTGRFVICQKIGDGESPGTIFKGRIPVGHWLGCELPDEDLILTRILRLDGLDPENANTLERCVYIHGTNREDLIGQPASHGCIRLSNADMVALFDLVSEGDSVEIIPFIASDPQMI